jgi:hypothetical protein
VERAGELQERTPLAVVRELLESTIDACSASASALRSSAFRVMFLPPTIPASLIVLWPISALYAVVRPARRAGVPTASAPESRGSQVRSTFPSHWATAGCRVHRMDGRTHESYRSEIGLKRTPEGAGSSMIKQIV